MRIICPNCEFSKDIPEDKVPPKATTVTCPSCKTKFPLKRDETEAGLQAETARPSPEPPRQPIPGREEYKSQPSMEDAVRGRSREEGVPWESKTGGMFSSLLKTIKEVLFAPKRFFSVMDPGGKTSYPLSFAVITGTVTVLVSLFLQSSFIMSSLSRVNVPYLAWLAGPILFVVAAIVTPFLWILALYVWTAVVHVSLVILRGNTYPYRTTLKVLAYSNATQLWSIIPVVGGVIGGIWGIVVNVIGLSTVHNISKVKAFFALFLFFILLFLIGLVVAIAIPLMFGTSGTVA